MVSSYRLTKDIHSFVEKIAASKIKGFYPSALKRAFGYTPDQYYPILENLSNDGILIKKYVVRNLYDPTEQIIFDNREDLPLGEYFDNFDFTDEFLLTEEIVEIFYIVADDFKKEMRDNASKKARTAILEKDVTRVAVPLRSDTTDTLHIYNQIFVEGGIRMAQYNNTGSNIGFQGDENKNSGIMQFGNESSAHFGNDEELLRQIADLRKYIEEQHNNSLNLHLMENLEDAHKAGNKPAFVKCLNFIKDAIGTVAQVASIASAVNTIM